MRLFPTEIPDCSQYLTAPSKHRSGLLMNSTVRFLVAYDTGNSGSTAAGNVRYYQDSRNAASASAHLFVDDRQVLECVPAVTALLKKPGTCATG